MSLTAKENQGIRHRGLALLHTPQRLLGARSLPQIASNDPHLLTGPQAPELLDCVTSHGGGELVTLRLDHVDEDPGSSATVMYSCLVDWGGRCRHEMIGLTSRVGGLQGSDRAGHVVEKDGHHVSAWIYPHDPDLPGLARMTVPASAIALLCQHRLVTGPADPRRVGIRVVSYRPRHRAVVRLDVDGGAQVFYIKALEPGVLADTVTRLEMIEQAGVPVPTIVAVTDDHLVITDALSGQPMARLIFDERPAVAGERLIDLLDALPASLSRMPRRPAWADAVHHYAAMITAQLPQVGEQMERILAGLDAGMSAPAGAMETSHGDFHEGQIHLDNGAVVGLLDVDSCGPGYRIDDLACLIAHLSTVQRMNHAQAEKVARLRSALLDVFDTRVDPVQLRLRAAATAISLATGPYRGQEADWQLQTHYIVDAAEGLLRQGAEK